MPYADVIGNLTYAMVYTRLDIAHAVGIVSRYMTNTVRDHWTAAKRIISTGTNDCYNLFPIKDMEARSFGYMGLLMFVDIDWESDVDNVK